MINRQDAKTPRKEPTGEVDDLARQIVDAAFKVHSTLGPGLLESVYETCLVYELRCRGIKVLQQVAMPIQYGSIQIDGGLRLDLLVENLIVVELKAVERLLPIHKAQVLTYLKLGDKPLGLLINFHVPVIKDGIQRIIL